MNKELTTVDYSQVRDALPVTNFQVAMRRRGLDLKGSREFLKSPESVDIICKLSWRGHFSSGLAFINHFIFLLSPILLTWLGPVQPPWISWKSAIMFLDFFFFLSNYIFPLCFFKCLWVFCLVFTSCDKII